MTTLEIIQSIILGLLIIGGGGFWLRKYIKDYYIRVKRENEQLKDDIAASKEYSKFLDKELGLAYDNIIQVLPFVDVTYLHKQPSVDIKTAFGELVGKYEVAKRIKYAEVEKKKVVVPMRPPKSN